MRTLLALCASLPLALAPTTAAADVATFELTWGSYGTADGQFRRPYHVAVGPNGDIYVADSYNARVQEFTATGGFVRAWGTAGTGPGQLQLPVGVTTDPDGNVYVTDNVADRVLKFSSDGTYQAQWDAPDGLDHPLGIASDASGNLYVADRDKNRVVRFSSTGAYLGQIGGPGSGPGQLAFPSDVAVDAGFNIYVADEGNSRIEKFTSGGTYALVWGTRGSGPGQFSGPLGIAVDSYGNVHVADTDNHRLQTFSGVGALRAAWGSPGSAPGHFRRPTGVATDAGHAVFVADSDNNRIQLFSVVFPPLGPGPCSASQDSPDSVVVTWTDVEDESGYHVYRDGALVLSPGANATSVVDRPGIGTHTYCIEAWNAAGGSPQCCAVGGMVPLAPPSSCIASDDRPTDVLFLWTDVSAEDGYKVSRDGSEIAILPANQTSYTDVPGPGLHTYCVASYRGPQTSAQCCDVGSLSGTMLPAPSPCYATDDRADYVEIGWTTVLGASGYHVFRDYSLLTDLPAVPPVYHDVPATGGPHLYCVQAFKGALTSPSCCDFGTLTSAAGGNVRLSWNSCDPQRSDTSFAGPGPYTLVISAVGVPGPNDAHDTQIVIGPVVPDAWRFEPGGCQPDGRVQFLPDAFAPECLALLGVGPLAITDFSYDLDLHLAHVRLAIAYNETDASPTQRYTLWKVVFDHSASIAGSDGDPATCDQAGAPVNLDATTEVLLSSGTYWNLLRSPADKIATWNGGVGVPVLPMTWGRLKALYR
jgi:DNA-binding beta-propeller fold protein YncE